MANLAIAPQDQSINIQNAPGGFSAIPHNIISRILNQLTGAEAYVFLFVWEQTVAYRQFLKSIHISKFVDSISYSEKSIWNAIASLQKTGWLTTVQSGSGPQMYGVSLDILEEAGCLIAATAPHCNLDSAKPAAPLKIQDLDPKRKKKSTPSYTPTPDTTPDPKSNEVAVVGKEGVLFVNQYSEKESIKVRKLPIDRIVEKYPDEPRQRVEAFCRKLEHYGVKDIERCMIWPLNFTLAIIKEFDYACQQGHNMDDPAACLHYRLTNAVLYWDDFEAESGGGS